MLNSRPFLSTPGGLDPLQSSTCVLAPNSEFNFIARRAMAPQYETPELTLLFTIYKRLFSSWRGPLTTIRVRYFRRRRACLGGAPFGNQSLPPLSVRMLQTPLRPDEPGGGEGRTGFPGWLSNSALAGQARPVANVERRHDSASRPGQARK